MVWQSVVKFFKAIGAFLANPYTQAALTAATVYTGVRSYQQTKNMLAKGQDILANKTSAGGKLPIIYGTRRVGAQIIYMDVSANDSRDMYIVYALSVGENEEIIGKSIELDGNPLSDSARFRDGGYIGSDKISSGNGSLNTVSQNGTGIDAGAGQFGTSPTSRYRYVFNLHHGAASQTADPMLVASMPNWTSAHRLDGVCYIACHLGYDKEGMWRGVPQLTVQVRGKKVFDPRDTNQTFGTVSTYKHSDNPALCFLDYITNNEYGKGLTQSQINMSTFTAAANVCDTLVDQPYFNGSAKSVTWEGTSGNDFFNITGTGADEVWWQNKIGELIDLEDGSSNLVLDGAEIKDVQRTQFYDANEAYSVYFNNTLGSTYSSQSGTSLLKVKRFHCNGYVDANKNVMENAKELLSNMRGIFLYVDGKYELSIEDTGSSTFSITDDHIISDTGISVDYGNKDKKANKVIVEFFNANKKYELDTATVLHDASPNYTSDDGGEVLEVKAEFPFVSDPYIAYNMAKAILTRSRNQTTMQFLGTPEMYKLNVGDIVDLTYAGLGFSGKVCRVEALELQSNGLVAVSLIEYFDVYTWEVPSQEPVEELANLPSAYAVKAPTGLSFTDSGSSSTGRPFLSWNEPTDFPNYQYRVNVVDSSSNQVLNKIVDVENCDLNFVKVGSNYVASVTSLNTLGVESSAATLTFTVSNKPAKAADVDIPDVVSAGNIISNGDNISLLNNNAGFTDFASGDVTQSFIEGKITNASNFRSHVAAYAATNPDGFTNFAASDVQDAITNDVTTISGSKITTGTINAANVNVINLNAANISTGQLEASRIVIDGVTIDTDNSTPKKLIIKGNGVDTTQLAVRAVGAMNVNGASGSSSFGNGLSGDNFNNLSTMSFTTGEAGEYLIVGNCMVGGTFNNLTQLESRIIVGSTTVADYNSPVGGAAIQPVVLAGKITLSADTTYTVTLQGQVIQENPNTTPAIVGFSTRISALKLNKQS